jgi:hypothetical protein
MTNLSISYPLSFTLMSVMLIYVSQGQRRTLRRISKLEVRVCDNPLASTSTSNRDIIEFNKSSGDITGVYYIQVRAYAFSYYSIYWYTNNRDKDLDKDAVGLVEGMIYTDYIDNVNKTIFVFDNDIESLNKTHIVSFSSANCNVTFQLLDENNNVVSELYQQDRTSQDVRKHGDNSFRYTYDIVNSDGFNSVTNQSCIVYISSVSQGNELLLNEGIPHQVTLGWDIDEYFYVYPHVSDEEAFMLSIYYDQGLNHYLKAYISFKEELSDGSPNAPYESLTLYHVNQDHILITKDELKKNCLVYPCNIHIKIKAEKFQEDTLALDLTYRVLAKSLNKKPVYVNPNEVEEGSQPPGVIQYYTTDIAKNQKGEVSIRTKSGSVRAFARIIRKDLNETEINADYGNIRLPTDVDFDLRMETNRGYIKWDATQSGKCDQGCSMYIAVYSDKYESFENYLIKYALTVRLDAVQLKLGLENSGLLDFRSNINYYTINVDKDSDEMVIYTEHTNNIELLVNLGDELPTSEKNDWKIDFLTREVEPNYKEKFVIKLSDNKFKGITSLRNQTFTIALKSLKPGTDNHYSLYVQTVNSKAKAIEPMILPFGSYTPCTTTKDDDICLYVINDLQNSDSMLLYAQQNKHHNTGIKLTIHAKIMQKTDFYLNYFDFSDLSVYPFSGDSMVNSEYLHIQGEDISDYRNKVIIIAVHSTKMTSMTLYSSLHQLTDVTLHTPIINRPYLVYLGKTHKSEFQFNTANYLVDIDRVVGDGEFSIAGNAEYTFSINKHRPKYKVDLNKTDKILFTTPSLIAFFLTYKNKFADYNLHLGSSYHFVILGGSFPMRFSFPLRQEQTNDNIFNLFVEKAIHENPDKEKDLLLYLKYSEINDSPKSLNRTWVSEYVKSVQTGSLVFTNEATNDATDSISFNKTGYVNVWETDKIGLSKTNVYDLLVLNVVLFPQNDGHSALPKNTYIKGQIAYTEGEAETLKRHIYILSRDHNKETFILIELSSCLGEVDFYIGELEGHSVRNATRHEYRHVDSYGKTLIELKLNSAEADAFLVIHMKTPVMFKDKPTAHYVLRYNSYADGNEYDTYNLDHQGVLIHDDVGDDFEFKWGSVSTLDEHNVDVMVKSSYLFKIIPKNEYEDNYKSICYSYGIEKYHRQVSSNRRGGDTMLLGKDYFTPGVDYFVALVATTDETTDKTLLSYTPVQLKVNAGLAAVPIWVFGKYKINY